MESDKDKITIVQKRMTTDFQTKLRYKDEELDQKDEEIDRLNKLVRDQAKTIKDLQGEKDQAHNELAGA